MRFADACFAAVVTLVVVGASHADGGLPYQQKQDVVYAEAHGTGLLMDVFTPTGKPNGLGLVDIASGAWYSDRNKIRDHTLAQVYTIFCSRGYVVFAVRPGSKTRYTAAEMDRNVKEAARAVSPLHRVEKPTIPFLLIHGDADQTVPLSQSKKLVEAITKAGGSAELIVKAGGGHPWLTLPEEVKVMADWFDKQLAGKNQ